jgi:7-keto-8-aminopelargonate synthetase-like enzyme
MFGDETRERFSRTLEEIQAAGLYKSERIITSRQDAHIETGEGRESLNLCANNYLGLASHPEIAAAARHALDEWGYGLSSVRFICGTQMPHKHLENALSSFLGTDDTILYSSCFDANGGLFETLLGPEDAVISDELNHASIIDGVRLCKAKRFRYRNNVMGRIDIITGTLGKALGGASGGYTSGRKELVDMLRQRSRPYLFSNSVPPMVVGASLCALKLLEESGELRERLLSNTKIFRAGLEALGFNVLPGQHPIVPVMLGDAALAGRFADALLERGIYVIGFSFPVVPQGKARIRTQVSAAHTEENLKFALEQFGAVKAELGI